MAPDPREEVELAPASALSTHPVWLRYGVAVGCVLLGWLAREALTPSIGPTALPFVTFYPAIAWAAWYGGLGPGVLAIALSALASNFFFFEPRYALELDDPLPLGAYILASGLIVTAVESMHRARRGLVLEVEERRRAERDVAASRDLLATTLASIGDGVIVTDEHGRVTSLNAEAERLTGWKAAEATSQPLPSVFRIVNERTRSPVESPVDKVFRFGTVVGLANHTLLIARDGTETPIDDSAAPVRQPGQSVRGVVMVFRDVREQRTADAARARLAAIVETSGDAILSKSLDGTVLTWNPAAERLFGYRPEEIVGRSVTQFIPPELQGEETAILDGLRRGQPTVLVETTRVAKNGRRIPVSIRVSPLRNAEGEVVGASKSIRDLSDLVAVRDALAEEKERLATTLASIGDAVIATDAEGRVSFLNSVAEELTEWKQDDALGRALPEVFHIVNETTRAEVDNPALRAMREGAIIGLANHTVLVSRSGGERAIDDSGAPIRDRHGKIVGSVLVFRDVTDRRRAEESLRESEARERAARVDAERANRAKDDFVAMLSHELRTPLNAILGWGQLIDRKPDDVKTVREGIQVITRNARVQADLVADLLDMSRILSGQLRLEVGDVALTDVVAAAVDAVRPAVQARGLALEVVAEPGLPVVRGDAGRLQQVVGNLLSNSVKFTPSGGHVEVALVARDAHVEIRVRDTGIGVGRDFLPHVFDRFRQGDSSTARRQGGLGLGLAIVKHLVERHGGSVAAESAGEGRGATFTVKLPLGTSLHRGAEGADHDGGARTRRDADPADLAGVDILVVDDQPDALGLLSRVLRESGAIVRTAASADHALAALGVRRPDIVLCDIAMPEKDGYQFIEALRARGDDTPALAVTAFAGPGDRERALRAGYQGHVSKPVEVSDVIEIVAALARKRGPG